MANGLSMGKATYAATGETNLDLQHPAADIRFWRQLVRTAVRQTKTPFYLFSLNPLKSAWVKLTSLRCGVPIRHWLSCKTQPVKPLLQWWQREGRGIEVVSEFELLAALREGFTAERILVNGPAKHGWLSRYPLQGLRVNLDSRAELKRLVPLARQNNWSLGVRCQTQNEKDPDNPLFFTQFGLARTQAIPVIKQLRQAAVRLETVHFHLRTNVPTVRRYQQAIKEVHEICAAAGFMPKYLDCGGGFPPPFVRSHQGLAYDKDFVFQELNGVFEQATRLFPTLQEIWLENGRFLSAGSGVLVVRVRDVKERRDDRVLICDGGRTTQALISQWETHDVLVSPARGGNRRPTTICGPTCMAFDQLTRRGLPASIRTGDFLIWMDAGAYHIPWETRFSHGAATVLWHDGVSLRVCRQPETFESWWGQWI
jgi:diaminopimelate decarboxylase